MFLVQPEPGLKGGYKFRITVRGWIERCVTAVPRISTTWVPCPSLSILYYLFHFSNSLQIFIIETK
jgi:hypothetical protein